MQINCLLDQTVPTLLLPLGLSNLTEHVSGESPRLCEPAERTAGPAVDVVQEDSTSNNATSTDTTLSASAVPSSAALLTAAGEPGAAADDVAADAVTAAAVAVATAACAAVVPDAPNAAASW